MGHIRLGTLPKTKPWNQVLGELNQATSDPARVAAAVTEAAEDQLEKLKGDPALTYCFWMLARVISASREADFSAALRNIGVSLEGVSSGAALVHRVSEAAESGLQERTSPNVFARVAELCLRETLSHEVASRAQSLFGGGFDLVQEACRDASTTLAFGRTAREFFANYLSRTIRLVTDKELGKHVGVGKQFESQQDALNFQASLTQYCRESARIVEEYAGAWLSKNNWEQHGQISEQSVSGFAAYALEKLAMEVRRGRK